MSVKGGANASFICNNFCKIVKQMRKEKKTYLNCQFFSPQMLNIVGTNVVTAVESERNWSIPFKVIVGAQNFVEYEKAV